MQSIMFIVFKVRKIFNLNAALHRKGSDWDSLYHWFIWPRPVEAPFPLKSSAP